MKKFSFLACIILSGCAMSEDKFQTDSINESCRLIFECSPEVAEMMSLADEAACVDMFTEAAADTDTSSCTYDAAKASECINESKAISCDDYAASGAPTACNEVYTCEESEGTSEETTEE